MSVLVLAVVLALVVVALLGAIGGGLVSRGRRRSRAAAAAQPEVAEPEVGAPGDQGQALAPEQDVVQELEEAQLEEAQLEEAQLEGVDRAGALAEVEEAVAPSPPSFRDRLGKARQLLSGYMTSVRAGTRIDTETWDSLEEALLRADVGVATTTSLLEDLRSKARGGDIDSPDSLVEGLKSDLKDLLADSDRSLHAEPDATTVWLFVGVNGVGKTTTIGKVAMRESGRGRSVVMAAADTFRAAAAEQLNAWAGRTGSDFVRGAEGADPGSVVFDAVQRAASKGAELVLADTAGRLHTKINLMEELRKIRRVADRPPGRVSEVLLVIDATTGQNGLSQAKQFTEAVGVTGVVLTKLDGTAKGGIVIAIARELGIPVKLVGLGESVEDLVEMDPEQFVEALIG